MCVGVCVSTLVRMLAFSNFEWLLFVVHVCVCVCVCVCVYVCVCVCMCVCV